MVDAPTTAYTEVQIDEDSISLTLISESGSNGPVIEDTERFTFEELQDMAGEHLTLRLSTDSREALVDSRESAVVGNLAQSENLSEAAEEMPDNPTSEQLLAYMGLLGGGATDGQESGDSQESDLPEVGDILTDTNAPEWSVDDRVEVVSISDKSADEYIVQESDFGRAKTVADVNYDADADETVIEAQYLDESGLPSGKVYGFPESRLVENEPSGSTMTDAFQ
jgi:hypothetical protein